MAQPDKTLVELYIYDLAQGMASHFSGLVGFALEGIWHTSIVVFGHEWFFGSGGIEQCPPGSTMLGQPLRKVTMGETCVEFPTFMRHLEDLSRTRFGPTSYKLLDHNCNTFSNELAKYLTGSSIPSYILELPERVKASPIASFLAPLIEQATPRGGDIHDGGMDSKDYKEVSRHFPHEHFLKFEQRMEVDKFAGKVKEVIERNMSSASFFGAASSLATVTSIVGLISDRQAGGLNEKAWKTTSMLLKDLPKDDVFPILDIVRYLTSQNATPRDIATQLSQQLITEFLSPIQPMTNLQLAVKILCNLTFFPESRPIIMSNREIIVSKVNTLLEETDMPSNVLQTAMASLALNLAACLWETFDQDASFQLVSAISTNFLARMRHPEALYRACVALGTLIVKDAESKDLAAAVDAKLVLARVKGKNEEEKLVEAVEDCLKTIG